MARLFRGFWFGGFWLLCCVALLLFFDVHPRRPAQRIGLLNALVSNVITMTSLFYLRSNQYIST